MSDIAKHIDRFRKVLERAGAKKKASKLARRLLEQQVHYQGNTPTVKLIKSSIGSELLDDYPPSVLKDLLLKAGLAYCPDSFGAAQWHLVPLGLYKECWEGVHGILTPTNTNDNKFAAQLLELQKKNEALETTLSGIELQMKWQSEELESHTAKLAATQTQIADIWAAIKHIEEHDKPVTAEKIERHLKLVGGG